MSAFHIPHVSEEVENYLRLHLLLNDISPKAVRILFDKEFDPSCLHTTIKREYNNLNSRRLLNAEQKKLLLPSKGTL